MHKYLQWVLCGFSFFSSVRLTFINYYTSFDMLLASLGIFAGLFFIVFYKHNLYRVFISLILLFSVLGFANNIVYMPFSEYYSDVSSNNTLFSVRYFVYDSNTLREKSKLDGEEAQRVVNDLNKMIITNLEFLGKEQNDDISMIVYNDKPLEQIMINTYQGRKEVTIEFRYNAVLSGRFAFLDLFNS